MLKRICLIIFLLIIPVVLAQNESANVVLTFVDAISKEAISDVFVNIDLNGKTTSYFLEKDETFRINLAGGDYKASFLLNRPSTEGADYYGDSELEFKDSLIKFIYLYPVGSLEGFVKDRLDNVIANANLKFECNEIILIDYPEKTDKYGSFSVSAVPVGNCKIYSSYRDQVGTQEMEIVAGNKTKVTLKLDQILVTEKPAWPEYLPAALVLIVIMGAILFYFLYFGKKRASKKNEISAASHQPEQLSTRTKDLMITLRDNEKKIINFLLEENKPVYLSRIHHKTGISKGSLFRNLRSLERKNIINSFMEGRVRKIKLSDWFLGH